MGNQEIAFVVRKLFGAIIALCLAAAEASGAGPAALPTEYEVKAAMLFNFAKFVEWPEDAFADARAPILIGILGEDPFGGAIDAARDKTIRGRAVQIRRFRTVQEVGFCHILFVSASEKRQMTALLRDLRGRKMLLVGDMEQFARSGGMINFVVQNDAVEFEINVDAVGRAGVKINARLLNIARIVRDPPKGPDD